MDPFYYRIKCTQCDHKQVEYKIMDNNEQTSFLCAVCEYKLVIITGHIKEGIYAKCSICSSIFCNRYEYNGTNITCPLDSKPVKCCDLCESVKNDVILRWSKVPGTHIIHCCDDCYYEDLEGN